MGNEREKDSKRNSESEMEGKTVEKNVKKRGMENKGEKEKEG